MSNSCCDSNTRYVLLKKMALFNLLSISRTLEQKLEDAITRNDLKELDKLIKDGIDVNMRLQRHGGNTAIHFAAKFGHFLCIDRLLASGARVDILNDSGVSPLYYAARSRHPLAMQTLLRASLTVKSVEYLWSHLTWSQMLVTDDCVTDAVLMTLLVASPDFQTLRPNLQDNCFQLCKRFNFFRCLYILAKTGFNLSADQLDSITGKFVAQFDSFPQSINETLKKDMIEIDSKPNDNIPADIVTGSDDTDDSPTVSDNNGPIPFNEWFSKYRRTPQSLQHSSRLAVRRSFNGNCNVFYGASKIPLPKSLKKYICFM